MKRIIFSLSFLLFFGCSTDDLSWEQEIDNIKKELVNQRSIIETLQSDIKITSIKQDNDSYTISFSNGQSVTLTNGITPIIAIGDNGNWFVNNKDTGHSSKGEDGETPSIEIKDGYWFINGENTSIKASSIDNTESTYITSIVQTSTNLIFYFSDGTSKCAIRKNVVICWGDSLTAGNGGNRVTYPSILNRLLGVDYSVVNAGVGGETSLTIGARQGGNAMTFGNDFILPSEQEYVDVSFVDYCGRKITPLL